VAELRAPMVGRVVELLVQPGATVDPDTEVLVVESMKMQIPINAPASGTVREIRVNVGDTVQEGDLLLVLD
jgi:acetyl-CoA carboxylase biotin carboxyl carrier protein